MSRGKYRVVRNRGPVPKKARVPYRHELTLRRVTADDIAAMVFAHRQELAEEWNSLHRSAEECIAVFGFDPHEGSRDEGGHAMPEPVTMGWSPLSLLSRRR